MKQDIKQYVKGCASCQANKNNNQPLKLAMILITPEHILPFQTVSMDFITKLPQAGGKYDTILMITDHDCSKAAIFIPCWETITAEGVATLYMKWVFPRFGIPQENYLRSRYKIYIKICKNTLQHVEDTPEYFLCVPSKDRWAVRMNK